MSSIYEIQPEFARLFGLGFDDPERVAAFGTGRGQWVKRPVVAEDIVRHLKGEGVGLGIPPLRRDGTVEAEDEGGCLAEALAKADWSA